MADRIRGILEPLIAAIQTVNEIIDQEVALNVRKRALRELCAALQQVVDYDNLWQALYESVSGRPSLAGVPDTQAFLESIADVLCDAHAALLLRCGYRSPPPPSAHDLIKQTRNAVLAENREPRWDAEHVEGAREALTVLVDGIVAHIKDANPSWLRRIGSDISRTAIGAAFVMLLSQAEITTGDNFSVELGASATDLMTIKITVPVPWTELIPVQSMGSIVAITSVDSLARIMDPATFEDPATVEDPDVFKYPDVFGDPGDL